MTNTREELLQDEIAICQGEIAGCEVRIEIEKLNIQRWNMRLENAQKALKKGRKQ